MKSKWILTNLEIKPQTGKKCFNQNSFSLYIDNESMVQSFPEDNIVIMIDGYVLPRNHIYSEYIGLSQFELIAKLYREYGGDFVNKIKGFFVIVILGSDEIILTNDIHSVKRFYIYNTFNGPIFSNDFSFIKSQKPTINKYAPSIQATFQHFIKGLTPYNDVEYSQSSTMYHYKNKKWSNRRYFDPNYFHNCDRNKTSVEDFIQTFYETINNTIKFLKPSSISATLTGGRDTRSVLAVLLKIGIIPHCFTFGFPSGIDVITANEITSKMKIPFSNYFIENLNASSYKKLVEEVIIINNPFIHLHRAHRLDAIKKEHQYFDSKLDMIFIGAMGGDYIKGEAFNDYIITEFLRLYLTASEKIDLIIKNILNKHFIKPEKEKIDFIENLLSEMNLKYGVFNKSVEFNLVHNIIGATHDIQDINLFMEYAKFVVAPFMDIDIMEALFSSPFSLFSNTRHSKNPFKRLKGGELQSLLIKEFSPALAKLNFANQYSPEDVLGNRFYYVLKRVFLHLFKIKPKPTFTYDEWMKEFIKNELQKYKTFVSTYYNYECLIRSLENETHLLYEGYWHKYSNPLYLAMYIN